MGPVPLYQRRRARERSRGRHRWARRSSANSVNKVVRYQVGWGPGRASLSCRQGIHPWRSPRESAAAPVAAVPGGTSRSKSANMCEASSPEVMEIMTPPPGPKQDQCVGSAGPCTGVPLRPEGGGSTVMSSPTSLTAPRLVGKQGERLRHGWGPLSFLAQCHGHTICGQRRVRCAQDAPTVPHRAAWDPRHFLVSCSVRLRRARFFGR